LFEEILDSFWGSYKGFSLSLSGLGVSLSLPRVKIRQHPRGAAHPVPPRRALLPETELQKMRGKVN